MSEVQGSAYWETDIDPGLGVSRHALPMAQFGLTEAAVGEAAVGEPAP